MDFRRSAGSTATTSQSSQAPQSAAPSSKSSKFRGGDSRALRYLVFALLLSGALLMAALSLYLNLSNGSSQFDKVNKKEYQAVFLTNGQVYFGKVTTLNDKYTVLDDVFYLQNPSTQQNGSTTANSNNYVLNKLGKTELHSPEDRMVINRDQISFWENIKDSSKVVSTIKQYKANPNAATQSTGTDQTSTDASTSQSLQSTPTTPTTNKKP